MKKKFIVIIISVLLIVCFLPLQRKIDVNLKGIQGRIADDQYSEEINIRVSGTYNDYLFKDDNFLGTITIDTYGEVWSISNGKLAFSDNIGQIASMDKDNRRNYFGDLLCEKDFSNLLILVSEKVNENSNGWTSENGIYIVAQAKNRDEASKVLKKLSEKNVWTSNIKWE